MNSTAYVVTAILFYSIVNVIIEDKLSKVSSLGNLLVIYITMLCITLPPVLFREKISLKLVMPTTQQVWLLVGCGVLFFVADYCYMHAYESGGSLLMVTTSMTLFPVVAAAIKIGLGGDFPSWRQWLGWALAVAAVTLVSWQDRPTAE